MSSDDFILGPIDTPIKCGLCGEVFKNKEEFFSHFEEIHENEKEVE